MSNNVKDININIINIKEFDSNIKLDESSYKKYSYLLHCIPNYQIFKICKN